MQAVLTIIEVAGSFGWVGLFYPEKKNTRLRRLLFAAGGRHDGGADNYTAQNRNVFALIFIALYCNV